MELRLSYQSPGSGILGALADRASAALIQGKLEESLDRLKARMEGEGSMGDESPGILGKATTVLGQGVHTVKTLGEAGLIRPQRPERTIRALIAMQRWGFTPAAGYVSPASAMLLGAVAALPAYVVIVWRPRTRLDETLAERR